MLDFTKAERRTMAAALCIVVIGTVVRAALAPDYGPRPIPGSPPGALNAAAAAVDSAIAAEAEAGRPLAPGERLDVNVASIRQLRRLPGAGRTRAAAIVAERTRNGPFSSPDDLVRVPGIGVGLLERWKPHLHGASDAGRTEGAAGAGDRTARDARRPAPPAIELNRAQPKELEQITGIGPVLAERIVALRRRRGAFRSYEDLLAVPGIGPRLLETVKREAILR